MPDTTTNPVSIPAHSATWFEIPSPDITRSQAFYESVLGRGLRREPMGNDTMAIFPYQQGGAGGCLSTGPGALPPSDAGTLVYLDCNPSIDAALARVVPAGGKVVLDKSALPPGMGYVAHIVDVAGNRVGLHAQS